MTGMPSFGKIEVPDAEIWSMVAFLKKLPMVSEEDTRPGRRRRSREGSRDSVSPTG
jgi:hypothetical protein